MADDQARTPTPKNLRSPNKKRFHRYRALEGREKPTPTPRSPLTTSRPEGHSTEREYPIRLTFPARPEFQTVPPSAVQYSSLSE